MFGIALGVVLAGERPTAWRAVGVLLVLASLWVVLRAPAHSVTT